MSILESIESGLQEAIKLKEDLFKAISDALEKIGRSDLDTKRMPNGNESIAGIQARLSGFCSLCEQVSAGNYDPHLVSYDYLKKFSEAIQTINTVQSDTLNQLIRVEQDGGLGKIDENVVISSLNNNQNFALGQGLVKLDNCIDRGLERYYALAPAITRPDVTQLSAFTRDFESMLGELKQAKANAKRDASFIKKKDDKANQYNESAVKTAQRAIAYLEQIKTSSGEAKTALAKTEAILDEANQRLPDIIEASKKADDLKIKITHHHEALDVFDAEMESRVTASEEGKEKLQLLIQSFEAQRTEFSNYIKERKQEVENLILRAEEMLGITTSAGLESAFKEQAKKRGTGILISYGVIAASLIIIAGIGIWAALKGWNEVDFLLKLAAIIPLAFLISIITKTLRKLELAKEYYEHKASVSQAIEGYRKLYDSTGDEGGGRAALIKSTVIEVLKNPAEKLSQTADEDHDLLRSLERLVDKIWNKLPSK